MLTPLGCSGALSGSIAGATGFDEVRSVE